MNYLYNGVELPDINEVWTDKESYPYAAIDGSDGRYNLKLMELRPVRYLIEFGFNSEGTIDVYSQVEAFTIFLTESALSAFCDSSGITVEDAYSYGIKLGEWVFLSSMKVQYIQSDLFWTSHDILNTDGTTYLAASNPIPVGSEPEKPTTFTPDPISLTMGWIVGRRIAGQRGKIQPDIPDVPDPMD